MYNDLHEHLAILEERCLLFRVKRSINKGTELHPLVRWQFRGSIPERERKAFLFENVTNSKGRRYGMPVVVAALAGPGEIYAAGMGCESARELARPQKDEKLKNMNNITIASKKGGWFHDKRSKVQR